ncbi:hypothetical protein BCV69DRAFT_281500 [Microstroma glucosiphilum]|uniref:Protein CASP n=1 Tax=Pseudomicrostroma glucosiphilum TaxID=1684307 RepID=A0A316UH57_9BASI|nr:hypothetical protein BCV69DRAFT_281500 [Pseudomicrostroma glucosiphilum]PWN22515.1 hypothetical protein BCV69DRAFT_281500 [Pseudomicrostroma glucosiphilum]
MTSPSSSSGGDFSSILSSYRTLSLGTLQSHLSSLVEPLTSLQTSSLASRKKLADQTREFKKLPEEKKVEGFKPLLKSYQVEIDELTKRAKDAEGGLRRVEERLRDVVDPVVVLEKVLDTTASLSELDSLKATVASLTSENATLKTKVSSQSALQTDRDQLSSRLADIESSFASRLQEAQEATEQEVTARFDERLSNATVRAEEMERSLSVAQESLRQLRSSHQRDTERLLLSSTAGTSSSSETHRDDADVGRSHEYEMISGDLQRANERVASLGRRNEQLREEVERVKSGSAEAGKAAQLETTIAELEQDKTRISEMLKVEQDKTASERESLQKRIAALEKALSEKERELKEVRGKLERQADYEEVKRELSIIRIVEFGGELDDDDSDEAAVANTNAKPLEALLLEKNKRLQDELTTLRVEHSELTEKSQGSGKELGDLRSEVGRLKRLNERLEEDLLEVGSGGGGGRNGTKGSAAMSAEEALDEMGRIEAASLTLSRKPGQASAADAATKTTGVPASSSSTKASASATSPIPVSPTPNSNASNTSIQQQQPDVSLLPIILSQRDRFRSRNAELEEELRRHFESITSLRNEVKSLQADNLGLYEKVRYLQSWSGGATGAAGGSGRAAIAAAREAYPPVAGSGNGGASSSATGERRHTKVPMNIASGSGGEDRWRSKYEESMNPFEAFRGREQTRAMSSLNPLERLLHMLTRLILADRRMRIFFMLYAVGMHLFIFGVIVDYTFYGGIGSDVGGTDCAVPAPVDPARR